MNIGSGRMKRLLFAMGAACVVMVMGTAAFAVPPTEALRIETNQTFSGLCCFSLGETVSITEPKKLVPVVVTFSTDYRSSSDSLVELSVNDHPCMKLQGMQAAAPADGSFASATFEWTIFPGDGLTPGNNKIVLCGGLDTTGASLTLGFRTLAVRISK